MNEMNTYLGLSQHFILPSYDWIHCITMHLSAFILPLDKIQEYIGTSVRTIIFGSNDIKKEDEGRG